MLRRMADRPLLYSWSATLERSARIARSAFRLQFAGGADLADVAVLEVAARDAGLDAAALRPAIADPAVKQRLRDATQAAWDAGVRGIPTLAVGGELYYGDDRLEAAP
jgi:2-hydroxychromene-2-carboxylate isomerase